MYIYIYTYSITLINLSMAIITTSEQDLHGHEINRKYVK